MKREIDLYLSSDCLGLNASGDNLARVWESAIESHNSRSEKRALIRGFEICTFPKAFENTKSYVAKNGLRAGLHGKIGYEKHGRPIEEAVQYVLDELMGDEEYLVSQRQEEQIVRYGLIHGWRYGENGIAEVIKADLAEGGFWFIENGTSAGSFVSTAQIVAELSTLYPGRVAMMIDWLHLTKEMGGRYEDFSSCVDRSIAMAEGYLSRGLLFGEHGPFGRRLDDSHDQRYLQEKGYLPDLKRLYALGNKHQDRLVLRVVENQQNGYLNQFAQSKQQLNELAEWNKNLLEFLREEMEWI